MISGITPQKNKWSKNSDFVYFVGILIADVGYFFHYNTKVSLAPSSTLNTLALSFTISLSHTLALFSLAHSCSLSQSLTHSSSLTHSLTRILHVLLSCTLSLSFFSLAHSHSSLLHTLLSYFHTFLLSHTVSFPHNLAVTSPCSLSYTPHHTSSSAMLYQNIVCILFTHLSYHQLQMAIAVYGFFSFRDLTSAIHRREHYNIYNLLYAD